MKLCHTLVLALIALGMTQSLMAVPIGSKGGLLESELQGLYNSLWNMYSAPLADSPEEEDEEPSEEVIGFQKEEIKIGRKIEDEIILSPYRPDGGGRIAKRLPLEPGEGKDSRAGEGTSASAGGGNFSLGGDSEKDGEGLNGMALALALSDSLSQKGGIGSRTGLAIEDIKMGGSYADLENMMGQGRSVPDGGSMLWMMVLGLIFLGVISHLSKRPIEQASGN